MKVNVPEEPTGLFEYLYKVEEGINEVDGGVEVLRQMQYPTEILDKLSN
jgi:DNA mismatch repair ATPase MutS